MKMTLKKKTLKGVKWQGISLPFMQFVRFGVSIYLARILAPSDFGTVGLTLAITNFLIILNELGFSAAIVQRKILSDRHLSTAFLCNLCLGIFSALVLFNISLYLSNFFRNKDLSTILKVYSIVLIIGSFGTVQRSILTKKMQFKQLSVIEIISTIIFGCVAISLAIAGYGVWSIICGLVISNIISNLLYWIFSSWKPSIKFEIKSFQDLFSFGISILGTGLVNQLSNQLDVMIVGRLLGSSILGIYSLSYRLALFIPGQTNGILIKVLFPAFAEIQDNTEKFNKSYIQIIKQLSIVTMPMMFGLIIITPEFVKGILTDKWSETIPIIRLLAIYGLTTAIGGGLWGTVLKSKGHPDKQFYLTIVRIVALALFIGVGSYAGIIGVAVAVALYGWTFRFIYQHIVNRIIGISMVDYLKALYPGTICTIVMVLVLVLIKFVAYRVHTIPDIALIMSMIIFGACSYIIFMRLAYQPEFNYMSNLIKEGLR